MKNFTIIFILTIVLSSCQNNKEHSKNSDTEWLATSSMEQISKPYIRYWWFASEIKKEDVKFNLDWLKENGFGGVEIAWVYPLNAMGNSKDTSYTDRQEWLSPDWQEIVTYTIKYADSIGLACDMTMGTLWPYGDSYVSYEEAAQQYGAEERQMISKSWEYPKKGYVVDHLNPKHYLNYFNRMLDSFPQPNTKLPQAYFVDSWEVETKKLWTDGFDKEFELRFGYDIKPYMDSLYNLQSPDKEDYPWEWHVGKSIYSLFPLAKDKLYDYMSLISEKTIAFYHDFDSTLNARGLISRGQCSGAPCDIISAYAQLDIPEGEAMLYEPEFNSIPASAALLSGKKVVSAETFTCLYGWPRNHIREEQMADLKLLADALFANGINHIMWHGKAHNPKDEDSVNFYATVHVGKEGRLAAEIPAFNEYLTKVSSYMKKGNTFSDVAVYLPTEDAWMKGIMPKKKQFIWAWGYYEMRYLYFPEELAGHHPIWINQEFLEKAKVENKKLIVGNAHFSSLYVDVAFLDYEVLKRINELAKQGLSVTLKQMPLEAGTVKHKKWDGLLASLSKQSNVSSNYIRKIVPLVMGNNLPSYWAREDYNSLYVFFANPKSRYLKFPIEYGQSFSEKTSEVPISVYYKGITYELKLKFAPYQSLLYKFEDGIIKQIDILFEPQIPVVIERSTIEEAPWLVK